MDRNANLILLTGASGYVGGRLLLVFESAGRPVRCITRHPEVLRARVAPSTEIVSGDVLNEESLRTHLAGVHTAYYLVHAIGASHSFEEEERRGAEVFAAAARQAGVKRLVYLGGLR